MRIGTQLYHTVSLAGGQASLPVLNGDGDLLRVALEGRLVRLTTREPDAYHFFGTASHMDALSPSLLHPPSRME
jgi:hypothetical protein